MDIDNKDALIEQYVAEKLQGRYLSEIRKELLRKGLPESEVSDIIQKIDKQVLQHELGKTSVKINKQIFYLGGFLIGAGIIVFLLGWLNIFVINRYLPMSVSATLAGLIMLIYALLFSNRSKIHRYRRRN